MRLLSFIMVLRYLVLRLDIWYGSIVSRVASVHCFGIVLSHYCGRLMVVGIAPVGLRGFGSGVGFLLRLGAISNCGHCVRKMSKMADKQFATDRQILS